MSGKNKRAAANRGFVESADSSGWLGFLGRASIPISAVAAAYILSLFRDLPARANQIDFSHYYVSALAMRRGIDPYTTDLTPLATSLGLNVAEMSHATYPPTFVLCFEPLTLLSPLPAYWLWIAMNVVFLALALYLLLERLPTDHDLRLALVGLAILYPPITNNFFYAQTQILILLLLILFMRWLESGRVALAGSVLALAGLLKLFPLTLMGYLLVRRQGKATLYTALGLILGGLLTFALVGVGRSLNFLQALSFLTSPYWLGRPANVALGATVSRLFWYSVNYLDPGVEFIRGAAVLLAELTLLALTVRATLGSSKLADGKDEHVIVLWVVTAVLLSPTAWLHYLVLLLIPYAVLVRLRLRGKASLRAARLGLASYLVAGSLMVFYLLADLLGKPPDRTWPTLAIWALMNGWSLCVLLAYGAAYSLAVGSAIPPGKAAGRALKILEF